MVTSYAVITTAIIHLLLRVSIFYQQPKQQCSLAASIGNWSFITSIFILLLDNDIYPCRYRCIPIPCQLLVETIISLLITEFSSLVLWCNLEKAIFSISRCILSAGSSNLYNDMGGDFLVRCLLTLLGLLILSFTAIATGYYDKLQAKFYRLMSGTRRTLSEIWRKRSGVRTCHSPGGDFVMLANTEDDDGLPPSTFASTTRRVNRRRQR